MPPPDIYTRTQDYSLRAISLCQYLQEQSDRTGWVLANQYLRSATSIGANMVEAKAAESRPDFIHKCAIAQKEARESLYWLTLMNRANFTDPDRLLPLIDETS